MSNKMVVPDQEVMAAVPEATPVPDPHPVATPNPAPGISEEATSKPDPAPGISEEATSKPDPVPDATVFFQDAAADAAAADLVLAVVPDGPDAAALQKALANDGGPIPNPPRQTEPVRMTKLPISRGDMDRWRHVLARFLSKLSDPVMRREVFDNVKQCCLAS